ncbi:peptidase domain-containing ABC transporter [Kistimonas scapharcae]
MSSGNQSLSSALECLAIVARYHHLRHSPESLRMMVEGASRLDAAALAGIAECVGLTARCESLSMTDLLKQGASFPVIAMLNNGNTVVVSGVRQKAQGELVLLVLDPLADQKVHLMEISEAAFASVWTGEVVKLQPKLQISADHKAFGVRWLFEQIAAPRGVLTHIFILSLLLHCLVFVVPVFTMAVFDKVIGYQGYATLHVLFVGAVIALLFSGVFGYLRTLLIQYAAGRLDVLLAERIASGLFRLPLSFFKKLPTGGLIRQVQESDRIREFITGNLLFTLIEFTAIVVLLPVMFMFSWQLTLLVLGFAVLIGLNALVAMGASRRTVDLLYRAEDDRQSLIAETLSGVETVRALAQESRIKRRWLSKSAEIVRLNRQTGLTTGLVSESGGLLQKLMQLTIIWYGAQQVLAGGLSIGVLIAFNIMAGRIAGPLVQLAGMPGRLQQVRQSLSTLGTLLNQPPERLRTSGVTAPVKGRIEFRQVSFSYTPEVPGILKAVSFQIAAGMKVAVVGASGSGKSTVARLMAGLYRPGKGQVLIDGINLPEYEPAYLRSRMGIVLQESFLFRGTVQENIAACAPHAGLNEIMEAARIAGAHAFIETLPQGYDTVLDEQGANLSGGQRQRLCIARAILHDPAMLLLDEATSALDPATADQLEENLDRLASGRTLVMVTHRQSLLQAMDKILLVEQGEVRAIGRHDELLASTPSYRLLWQRQVAGEPV